MHSPMTMPVTRKILLNVLHIDAESGTISIYSASLLYLISFIYRVTSLTFACNYVASTLLHFPTCCEPRFVCICLNDIDTKRSFKKMYHYNGDAVHVRLSNLQHCMARETVENFEWTHRTSTQKSWLNIVSNFWFFRLSRKCLFCVVPSLSVYFFPFHCIYWNYKLLQFFHINNKTIFFFLSFFFYVS